MKIFLLAVVLTLAIKYVFKLARVILVYPIKALFDLIGKAGLIILAAYCVLTLLQCSEVIPSVVMKPAQLPVSNVLANGLMNGWNWLFNHAKAGNVYVDTLIQFYLLVLGFIPMCVVLSIACYSEITIPVIIVTAIVLTIKAHKEGKRIAEMVPHVVYKPAKPAQAPQITFMCLDDTDAADEENAQNASYFIVGSQESEAPCERKRTGNEVPCERTRTENEDPESASLPDEEESPLMQFAKRTAKA